MKTDYRLGIDACGTFTDFVLADRTGNVRLFKALSTPQDPTLAIRNGPYGKGPIAYVKVLEDWRAEGGLTGLELAS